MVWLLELLVLNLLLGGGQHPLLFIILLTMILLESLILDFASYVRSLYGIARYFFFYPSLRFFP